MQDLNELNDIIQSRKDDLKSVIKFRTEQELGIKNFTDYKKHELKKQKEK